MSDNNFTVFDELDFLIENQLYEDAYKLLTEIKDKDNIDYLFYLAFLEAQLGQSDEAINTLMKLSQKNMDDKVLAIFHGFAADILNNEGYSSDALEEILNALDLDPNDELINKKYDEILDDFSDDFGKFLFILKLLKMQNKK